MNNQNNEPLENLIEAALFFKGGSMAVKEIAEAVGSSLEETEVALKSLTMSLEDRGLSVVLDRDRAALATSPAAHEMIEKMRRDELDGPLGRAGLETLAVIIFRGPRLALMSNT